MIDGLQHVEGDNKCNICQTDFTDDEGGMLGYIGILPIAFCPFCYSGICDMMDQLDDREWEGLTDEEMLQSYGWRLASGAPNWLLEEAKQELLGALRKVEDKLKEKNGYE
jgi:hypothetical protein